MEDNTSNRTDYALDRPSAASPLRKRIIWLLLKLNNQLLKMAFRHQVLVPELENLIRWQGVRLALDDDEFVTLSRLSGESSAAHAAVLTGLSRREIGDIQVQDQPDIELDGGNLHRLIRIVTAWSTQPDYLDANGQPIDLPLSGKPPSLHALNREYGRNVPDAAIADWLVRNGNAEWVEPEKRSNEKKTLRWQSPVINSKHFTEDDILIIGQIGVDFLHSFQKTTDTTVAEQPCMRETYFCDIPASRISELHTELKAAITESGNRYREVLKKYRDPEAGDGIRIGVGTYSFIGAPLLSELHEPIRSQRSFYKTSH